MLKQDYIILDSDKCKGHLKWGADLMRDALLERRAKKSIS